MTGTPIIYEGIVPIRFSELDPYGHVNAKHYLDIVATARMNYMREELNCSFEQVMERGIGFYVTKAEQNFHRSITSAGEVLVTSHVDYAVRATMRVVYQILSLDRQTLFASGTLTYAIMDLKKHRPCKIPDWTLALFFSGIR